MHARVVKQSLSGGAEQVNGWGRGGGATCVRQALLRGLGAMFAQDYL